MRPASELFAAHIRDRSPSWMNSFNRAELFQLGDLRRHHCTKERLCNALPGPILALRPETGNLGAKRDRLAGQIESGRG